MKTVIRTLCILVFLGFTTQSQAQTKEETITWLKEKLGEYMVGLGDDSNVTIGSIDECKIVFNYLYDSFGRKVQYQQILPTAIASINGNGNFIYNAALTSNQAQGHVPEFSKDSYLKLADREENIRSRVEKALKHLATFCPKKQETF